MAKVSKDMKERLFYLLLKSRRFEEALVEIILKGEIDGWLHPMLGQEAIGVGIAANLKKTDIITNTHRGRAISITKGVPLKRFMAEVLGRKEGSCGGVAGELHFCDKEYGILGNSGILGATIPIAVGVAMASKYLETQQVVVSVCGDGTVDEGNFHESVNIASLWKLPIVFAVENNGWAQFTPQKDTAAQPEIWRKAEGYNITGIAVDGANVLEVYETTRKAVAKAQRGEGPSLIEYKVNRWLGHYIGDPQAYRNPGDIEEARKVDPVSLYKESLLKEQVISNDDIQKVEKSIMVEINEAVEYAKNLPLASVKQAFENVYV